MIHQQSTAIIFLLCVEKIFFLCSISFGKMVAKNINIELGSAAGSLSAESEERSKFSVGVEIFESARIPIRQVVGITRIVGTEKGKSSRCPLEPYNTGHTIACPCAAVPITARRESPVPAFPLRRRARFCRSAQAMRHPFAQDARPRWGVAQGL